MSGVVTTIRSLRERGFRFEAVGDKVRVYPPTPDAVEEARDLLEELRQRKPEVLAALQRLCPGCLSESWAWTHDGRRVCRRCLNLPPRFGEYCRPRPIPEAVAAEVKRIEDEALALGWTERELWAAAGWVSHLGLAALMKPGDAVERVAADAITIRLRDGKRLRLYRGGRLN